MALASNPTPFDPLGFLENARAVRLPQQADSQQIHSYFQSLCELVEDRLDVTHVRIAYQNEDHELCFAGTEIPVDTLETWHALANQVLSAAHTNASLRPSPFASQHSVLIAPVVANDKPTACFLVQVDDQQVSSLKLAYLRTLKLLAIQTADRLSLGKHSSATTTVSLSTFHHGLNVRQTAYNIANEGRRLVQADRSAVLLKKGKRYKVEAVSGQSEIQHRAALVRCLRTLVQKALVNEQPFLYPSNEELAPQLETALQEYLDLAHIRKLVIQPLHRRHKADATGPIIGALVTEWIQIEHVRADSLQHLQAVQDDAELGLTNSLEHSQVFLLPIWKTIGKLLSQAYRWKTLATTIAVAGLIAALFVIPTDLEMEASGSLQPSQQRHVFVRTEGTVANVLVQHGDTVRAGDVLVTLQNAELERQADELLGQVQTASQKLTSIKATRLAPNRTDADAVRRDNQLASEEAQLVLEIEHLQRQHQLVQQQQDELQVRSPIDGEIATWDVQQLLDGRPVQRGQELLTIVNPNGPWQLELELADHNVGPVLSAAKQSPDLNVEFILGTRPEHKQLAKITRIAQAASVNQDDQTVVQVIAQPLDLEDALLRTGADVRARIQCGKSNLAKVWFRDVMRFVHQKILFRLPEWQAESADKP
ncbi:MAG: HlyD family efflux transporter periplasmic adaptor subunit [Pirellulaceae bacterium]